MNLYLIIRNDKESPDYDEYRGAVVAAEDTEEASRMFPGSKGKQDLYIENVEYGPFIGPTWVDDPKYVDVRFLGKASKSVEKGVILADFNAG